MARKKGKKKSSPKRRASPKKGKMRITLGDIGKGSLAGTAGYIASLVGIMLLRNAGRKGNETEDQTTTRVGLLPVVAPVMVSGMGALIASYGGEPVIGISAMAGAIPAGVGVVGSILKNPVDEKGQPIIDEKTKLPKQAMLKKLVRNAVGLAGDEDETVVYSVPLSGMFALEGGNDAPLAGEGNFVVEGNDMPLAGRGDTRPEYVS